ncbi:hypothetical protein GCM10010176_033290 [Nonomuraea spiralis]|nr:hypothetical protein GCM10010176_033290 [Nonomuraea spiralis]
MAVRAHPLTHHGPDDGVETRTVSASGEHSYTHGGFLPMGFTNHCSVTARIVPGGALSGLDQTRAAEDFVGRAIMRLLEMPVTGHRQGPSTPPLEVADLRRLLKLPTHLLNLI